MNKWYMTSNSNLMLDSETDKVLSVTDCYTNINCCYIAPEDCTLVFTSSETTEPVKYDVKKGQIVITFYKDTLPNRLVILDSEGFRENLQKYMDDLQKEKERWAAEADNKGCASPSK